MDENPQKPASEIPSAETSQLKDQAIQDLRGKIEAALKTVYDPEIPVNIYDMGLIYGVDVDSAGKVIIQMTLTSPGCPVAGYMPSEVERKVFDIPGVVSCRVDLVWDPPWDPSRMSEAAKLQLGFF
jgi:FeS assembly SUF system protein